jgi:hypothetical protein
MINERIKLPAQEWLGYDPERGDLHGYTVEQMREFAEQIVLECGQMMVDLEGKYPANLTVREIKQHFGITVKQHAAAEWPMEL